MGIINQQVCDGCGKILFGRNGTVVTKKSYIQLNGKITTHRVDSVTGWVDHMYLTPIETPDLSFCLVDDGISLDCMKSYLEARVIIAKQKMEAAKRRMATEEHLNKPDENEFGEFTVGSKDTPKYGKRYGRG